MGCLAPDRGAYVEMQLDVAPSCCTHLSLPEGGRQKPSQSTAHDPGLHSYATILRTLNY